MSDVLTIFSSSANVDQSITILQDGVVVSGPTALTPVGAAAPRVFTATVPGTLPEGRYQHVTYRTTGSANAQSVVRSVGEFYWTGTDIYVSEEIELSAADLASAVAPLATSAELATAEADIIANTDAAETALLAGHTATLAAITAAVGTLSTDISDAENLISGLINGLNNITVAQIEAALINDGDGQAFRTALATTIEQALANAADGEDTIALFEGAVASALATYDAATGADVTAAQTAIQADIAAIDTVADVATALTNYGAATQADLVPVLDAINLLEDLSAADVAAELATYDGATQADLNAAVATLQATQGLSVAQAALLTFIRDVLESDEIYNVDAAGNGTAQKLLKGTTTVLVDKNVTSTPACEQSTSIIEA